MNWISEKWILVKWYCEIWYDKFLEILDTDFPVNNKVDKIDSDPDIMELVHEYDCTRNS